MNDRRKVERRTCESKRRHPDELTARAAAMDSIKKYQTTQRLFVYQCGVCRGWHLTRRRNPNSLPVNEADPVAEAAPEDQVLAVVKQGPVETVQDSAIRDHQWLHAVFLRLEALGRVIRKAEQGGKITWEAA